MDSPSSIISDEVSDPTQGRSKYGKQFGEGTIPMFKGTGKSGLTPIDPVNPNVAVKPESQKERQLHEAYQRKYLRQFTSRELQDADSLEIENLALGGLGQVPLHPVFQRNKWSEEDEDIGDGIDGKWGGQNDKVWEVLQPCLRLATRLLENSQVGLW